MPGLLDLLAPPRCAVCDRPGPLVCAGCLGALRLLDGAACARCGKPTERPVPRCVECRGRRLGFDRAACALAHEGAGRRLVHGLKHGGLRGLSAPAAALMATLIPSPGVDVLTWVPADRWRELLRGYHPPRLIALQLASHWGIPAVALLEPARARRSQRGLDPRSRRANVRDAFRCRAGMSGAVALIDDVYTTGATLSACAVELRRGGARRVEALCLARAVRD
ncbi:MAG: double zinc ribbon domain-containing protein [Gaiellales bacterium]